MYFDLFTTLALMGAAAVVGLIYLLRVAMKGRAQFDRVDKQGGSALLAKEVMEGAYWFLQPLGKFLILCRVTPNQVSWMSLVLGLIAGACFAFGHFGSGAAFATISALLDALDGMVARATGMQSDAGEVLDAAVDRYAEFFFLAGLAIYYREIPVLFILTLLAFLGCFMVSYSSAKSEALHIDVPKGNMRRPERALYLILGAALSPVTIPWFEATRELPIPIGHPMVVALCLVAVLANISAVERFWAIAKAIRVREAEQKAAALSASLAEQDADAPVEKARTLL
jgi:CDP-diacylglycerol--glycerol-3-phosphate 3-phosphatidyltransferase